MFTSTPGMFFADQQSLITNVLDFSPIDPSGKTDSTSGFQKAINAIPPPATPFDAVGGGLWVPVGTYLVSGLTLTWPIAIYGAGWGTSIKLAASANKYIFAFTPQASFRFTGAVFSHFKLDCNGANQSSASGGFDANGACYCLFDHLWIEAPFQYGISLHDDNLGGFGHHNIIRGRTWFHNGTSVIGAGGIGVGVRMHNSDENLITENIFEQCGSPGGSFNNAALFDDGGLQAITHNVFVADPNTNGVEQMKLASSNYQIIGNIFDGGTSSQLEVTGNNAVIIGNKFYRPINTSACLQLGGTGHSVENNAFESSPSANASQSAVNGASLGGLVNVSGNTVVTNGSWQSGGPFANITNLALRNNVGYNPVGSLTPPGFPASTVAVVNTSGSDVTAYITNGVSAITQIQIAGAGGSYVTTGDTIGASGVDHIRLPVGAGVKFTYAGGTPSWTWFGE